MAHGVYDNDDDDDDDHNNHNNNNQVNVYGAVIMTQSHCESSPRSYDEYRTASDIYRPFSQAGGLEP